MPRIITQFACALLLLLFCVGVHADKQLSIPDMGDPSYIAMDLSKEQKLGRVILARLRSSLALVRDIELQEYLNSISYRVLSYSPNPSLNFYFMLVQNKAINAFASPGGIIAINSGLILSADSEDEVAGVIAHEISHIEHRHIPRLYALTDQTKWVNALQVIVGLIATAYSTDLGLLGWTAAATGPIERFFHYSRAFEKEADYSGIQLLYKAGYNPSGMVSFFSKMQARSSRNNQQVPEFLRTHPLDIDRLSTMQRLAQRYPQREQQDSQDFAYAKASLQALAGIVPKSSEQTKTINLYRQGVSLMKKGFGHQALQAFEQIEAPQRKNKMVGIAIAKALMMQGRYDVAEKTLRTLGSLYVKDVSISYYLTKALLKRKKPAQALKVLNSIESSQNIYPQLIALRAEIAEATGKSGLNHEYLSDYYYAVGKLDLALKQLKLADAMVATNSIAKERIATKRKAVLNLKKEMEE